MENICKAYNIITKTFLHSLKYLLRQLLQHSSGLSTGFLQFTAGH